jgi:concentrative nucleoside transporter, CNT family
MPPFLSSLIGMCALLAIGWALSESRRNIRWRTVAAALGCQVTIGALVFFTAYGRAVLVWVTTRVGEVIGAGQKGIDFLFGPLVSHEKMSGVFHGEGFVFALRVLPVIIFLSSLVAVLYHLGIMQWVVRILGGGLRKLLGTSPAESLSAAANIFVGQTEAPLVVRPYIARMTPSELFAVMVGGLASVAGSVLVGYVGLGADMRYLLAASFMAAPGGLLFAKLIKPETSVPMNATLDPAPADEKPVNVLDAAALGASDGLKLALNVGAMLLAFIGIIALLNLMLGGIGAWFGYPELSLQLILGWLFFPVAWLMGIPWEECLRSGSLVGQKLVLNEFVAFGQFQGWKESFSPRTQAMITVALCGFANFSSIAILIGGLGGMAPARRPEIARFGVKAVLAGTLSNLTSATIVGIFWTGG